MSKPAGRDRNSNPVSTPSRFVWSTTFVTRNAATETAPSNARAWMAILRQSRGAAARSRAGSVSCSLVVTPCGPLRLGSAERRGDHDAAVLPQPVQTAGEAERRSLAEIAGEDLAVVAHLLDRLQRPVGRGAELRSQILVDAQQPPDFRMLRVRDRKSVV